MSIDPEFIRIATGVGAHGLNGCLKVHIVSDVLERFDKDNIIYACVNGFYKKYLIKDFELYKNRYGLIFLENVNDKLAADQLSGIDFYISMEDAESGRKYLEEDTFFYFDLIGCQVYYKKKLFGEVKELLEGGSGNILVIRSVNNKEYLIPFVKSMVDISNLASKEIEIFPVEGLLEEQELE